MDNVNRVLNAIFTLVAIVGIVWLTVIWSQAAEGQKELTDLQIQWYERELSE